MRKYPIPALLLTSLLSGCSHHYAPLEPEKKEKLVSELVATSPQCGVYREKLKSPFLDDDGVDAIYHAAMKAHCIKKDV